MALDPEATRRRIFEAATAEFAAHGGAGARVDRIAAKAKANKESIYRYYGTKDELLHRVLDQYLDEHSEQLLPRTDNLGDYLEDVMRFHAEQPELLRLNMWEALESGSDSYPDASVHRRRHFREKVQAVADQQDTGGLPAGLDPRFLLIFVMAAGSYWFMVPQVIEFILGEKPGDEALADYRVFAADMLRRVLAATP